MIDRALKELASMIGKGEKVLWYAKPDKKCFILETIFNPFLPFALVWLIFDSAFIFATFASQAKAALIFILPFFLLHLTPVWIYLGIALLSTRQYQNTAYIITTKGVYVSSGIFVKHQEMRPFADLSHINIHRGIFDQYLGVGDVITVCGHESYGSSRSHSSHGLAICDIPDYKKVFQMISDLQTDIYSDTMYPNALRPQNNPGYNTQYNKYDPIDFNNQ